MKKVLRRLMVVCLALTMLIPAVPAEAAAEMKLSRSAVTLYKNEDNKSGISNSVKLSIRNKPNNFASRFKCKWSAENTSIVSVNKNGVITAKKVGSTTVQCNVIKKSGNGDYLYTSLNCIVRVYANAETVEINNAPENNQITIGSTFDFNRTMKAANGGKATDKTEWFSSDNEILTIDRNGIATGISEGTVKIRCSTYQSAATKSLGYTANSEELEITVLNSIKDIKISAVDTIVITMFADITCSNNDICIKDSSGIIKSIKAVSFNGSTITITTNDILKNNSAYSVSLMGKYTDTFTVSYGIPYSITLSSLSGPANTDTVVDARILDVNGVDVTRICNDNAITCEPVQGERYIIRGVQPNQFHIFNRKAHETVTFKLTYHSYIYSSITGEEEDLITSDIVYSFGEAFPDPEPEPIITPSIQVTSVTSAAIGSDSWSVITVEGGSGYDVSKSTNGNQDYFDALFSYCAEGGQVSTGALSIKDDARTAAQDLLLELFAHGCIQYDIMKNGVEINGFINGVLLPTAAEVVAYGDRFTNDHFSFEYYSRVVFHKLKVRYSTSDGSFTDYIDFGDASLYLNVGDRS